MLGVFYGDYQAPLSRGDFGSVFPGFIFPLAAVRHRRQADVVGLQPQLVAVHATSGSSCSARVTPRSRTTARTVSCWVGRLFRAPLDTSLFPRVSSDESAWGGTLKLLRHLNDQVTVYAGIDRGFRLGGINNLGQPNYDTEIALNYEIGLKGLFLDNTLRLNASVFHTDYDGYQVVQYNSEAFTFIVQNADVIGQGVELDAQWAPTSGLELGASLAWNDTYYDSFVGAPCDSYQLGFGTCPNDPVPGAQDLTDEQLSAAPKWVGNLNAQYTAGLGSTSLEWFMRGEYSYRGSSLSHPVGDGGDPMQEIDSYGLVNASLGLSSARGWDITLWGKNLTDKDYFTNISRAPVGSEPDYVTARIGMERSYGVTLIVQLLSRESSVSR